MAEIESPIFDKIVSLFSQSQATLKRRIILLDVVAVLCFATLIGTEILLLQMRFTGRTELSLINPILLGTVLIGILRYRHHLGLRLQGLVMKTERLKANLSDHGMENVFIPAMHSQQSL
ncbi:MAG: hypothetical protein HGB11_02865 [Chlorobiales bacterium]|nr:hypothetical protein [Chlorobiales bacterium]